MAVAFSMVVGLVVVTPNATPPAAAATIVTVPASIAGNTADADEDGVGDNVNDLASGAPVLAAAGVNLSGGGGSNGTVRYHVEFPTPSLTSDQITSAQVVLTTQKGSVDNLDTEFFFANGDGDGLLSVGDFETPATQIAGVVMPVPTYAAGTIDTFAFDVTDQLKTAVTEGRSHVTIQGRVADEATLAAGTTSSRGLQMYTSVDGTNDPQLVVTTTLSPSVTTTADGGAGSLRQAIIDANASAGLDVISVPAGTYSLTLTGAEEDAAATGDLDITDDLTIVAPDGPVVIDAGPLGDRAFHVLNGATATLDGLTIANASTSDNGGGVLNEGDLTVVRSTISDSVGASGGGIYNDSGTLVVDSSTISSNQASGSISGLLADQENTAATGTTVGCGTASGSLFQTFTPTAADLVSVELNFRAGGSFTSGLTETVRILGTDASGAPDPSTVLGTTTATPASDGWVSFVFASPIALTVGEMYAIEWQETNGDAHLTWFQTGDLYAGGAAWSGCGGSLSGPDIADQHFITFGSSSSTAGHGGGIFSAGPLSVTNSTVHGNQATGDGGGVGLGADTALLNNVTLTDNSADGTGGAFNADPGSLIQIANSLSAFNTGSQIDCSTFESLGHNVLRANPAGCTLFTSDIVDPAAGDLGPLTDNGGPTPTRALLPTNPAIDAGAPSLSYPTFDSTTIGDWQLNGFTDLDTGGNLLLAAGDFNAGSAYLLRPLPIDQSFDARFQFDITPGPDGDADGITFTISDDPSYIGTAGGFLGIAEFDRFDSTDGLVLKSTVNGVSIEFDTWVNGEAEAANDPNGNHIGVNVDGDLSSVALNAAPGGSLSDGPWTAWVEYDAANTTLDVWASNTGVRPTVPTVSANIDIAAVMGTSGGHFGFTAATGSSPTADISGTHRILDFSFSSGMPCATTDQRGVNRPVGPACDSGAFELDAPAVPTELTVTLSDGGSVIGERPIFAIDDLDVGSFFGLPAGPSSTQLGAIQLGAIQLGAIQLGAIDSAGLGAPSGYLTIDSILEASDQLAASTTILDQITLVDVPIVGGWDTLLALSPTLTGRPPYTVTLQQAIDDSAIRAELTNLRLAESGVAASQLGAIQLGAIQLGAIQLGAIDTTAAQLGAIGTILTDIGGQLQDICSAGEIDCGALGIDPTQESTYGNYSITALTLLGVDIDFAQLGAIQLGAIQLGAIDPNDTQLGAIQLGAIQLGAIDTANGTIGNTQLGAIQLGAIQLGAIQLGAIEAAIDDTVVGGNGSLEDLVTYWCGPAGGLDCDALGIVPTDATTYESYSILALGAMGAQLGAIQLGAIQLGAIDNLASTQLGAIQLGAIEIDGTAIADTQLGAIQLGAIDPAATQLGAIQLGAIQLGAIQLGAISPAATQLGAIQLGAIQLGSITSPTQLGAIQLGAIQLGAINGIDAVIVCGQLPGGSCTGNENLTLVEAAQLGAIQPGATLQDLEGAFGSLTLQDLADAGVDVSIILGLLISDFYPETTIAELPPGLTLDQIDELWVGIPLFELLLAIMDPGDLAWEDVDPDVIAAQNPGLEASWAVTFELAGTPGFVPGAETPFSTDVTVTLPDGVSYVAGTSSIAVNPTTLPPAVTGIDDPTITNGTLTWTIDGVELNDSIYLGFQLATAFTADDSVPVTTSVEALGFTAGDTGTTIVTDAEPNDSFADAIELTGDVVVLGRTDTPGDVDMFELNVAPGGSIEAYLTPGDIDLDLVLFESQPPADAFLREAPERVVDGSLDPVIGIDPTEQDQESLDDIVNTDLKPVFKASLRRGTASESIITPPLRNGGEFFLQITSYNAQTSDAVYTGRVRILEPPASSVCSPRSFAFGGEGTSGSLPTTTELAGAETIYLMNTELFGDTYGAAATSQVLAAIDGINTVPGAPNGVVIPVEGDPAVSAAYATWLDAPGNCSVDAANDVASAIAELVDGYRAQYPTISSAVIVGGDDQVPFFRVDDQGIVANERDYLPTFSGNNPLVASLRDGAVLTDAPYTDPNPLYVPQGDREVFVSQLPTGRLVEQPAEIIASLNQFVASGGLLDVATDASPDAEVLGYDFLSDSSTNIADELTAQGFDVTSLINETWTKTDLEAAYDSTSDVVNGNAHFDHTAALPAQGNLSSVFTDLYTVDDLEPTTSSIYAGTIIYTMGCHAGLNAPASYMDPNDPLYDWAQALLDREAVYLANTGFGYGDSDFQAYSEELMALFTEQFAVSNSVGEAFLNAQQLFASQTPKWSPYHDKSLMEATLYGLPFYRLTELDVAPPEVPRTATTPVAGSTLESAEFSTAAPIVERGGPAVDRYLVADDVLAVPFRPVQPIEYFDVTPLADGLRAAGAVIESGTSVDEIGFDVLYARPIVYNEAAEPEIETTGPFPNALQSVTSYETAAGRADRLLVARGRYFPEFSLQQTWSDMDLTVYYAPAGTTDVTAPKITTVNAAVVSSFASFDVEVSDAESDVLRVVVLYRGGASGTSSSWSSVDLVQNPDGTWSGGGPIGAVTPPVDYLVQAVNSAGLVGVNTFKGEFHEADVVPPPSASTVTCNDAACETDWYQGAVTVEGEGQASVDGGPLVDLPITLDEDGLYQVEIQQIDGSSTELVVGIDTTPPELRPGIDGSVFAVGAIAGVNDVCVDAVSGVAACDSLDTSVAGVFNVSVSATDGAGNSASLPVTYAVVEPLTVTASPALIAITESTTLTTDFTYSGGEPTVMIDWGDGSVESCTPSFGACGFVIGNAGEPASVERSHGYTTPGVYRASVVLSHDGRLVQEEAYEFIVVYDPNGGFVTGGGWIDSPEGAYTADATLTGRANFGFVSKYKKGQSTPSGNTTFQFRTADFEFKSTSYDWMVIAGHRAQYKGWGTINGSGDYGFMLTAIDAALTPSTLDDLFRIKIWDRATEEVVYDNELGAADEADPTTTLGGGSIVIHDGKKN